MEDMPEWLANRLVDDGQKTIEFFRSLAPQAWETVVYTEHETWNVRQILAHLVSAEEANAWVIADVLSGGAGAPDDFEIDLFNAQQVSKLKGETSEGLLTLYSELRRATVAHVARMNSSDLVRTGRHPFLGQTALEEIIKLVYRHNQIHLRDIRRALKA
jgi:hypothetical protein